MLVGKVLQVNRQVVPIVGRDVFAPIGLQVGASKADVGAMLAQLGVVEGLAMTAGSIDLEMRIEGATTRAMLESSTLGVKELAARFEDAGVAGGSAVTDQKDRDTWVADGLPDARKRACDIARKILSAEEKPYLDAKTDQAIRNKYDILL